MEENQEERPVLNKSRGGGTACCVHLFIVVNEIQNCHTTNFLKKKKCDQHEYTGLGGKTCQVICSKCALTIFLEEKRPKIIKPTQNKPRTTFKCWERILLLDVSNDQMNDLNKTAFIETGNEPTDINELKQEILNWQSELGRNKQNHDAEIKDLKQQFKRSRFSLDRFKDSDSDIEFYTGFFNYSKLKDFLDFLSPACRKLRYVGSNNKIWGICCYLTLFFKPLVISATRDSNNG